MNISTALEDIKLLAIDTAPFIYYVENFPDYVDKMGAVLRIAESAGIEIVSSVVTFTEVLTKPLRSGDKEAEKQYRTLFLESGNLRVSYPSVNALGFLLR